MTRITGTLLKDQYPFSIIPHSGLLKNGNFLDKIVEKIKTHILCSVTFFFNRDAYEIMWKNIVERGRLKMTIWGYALHAGYLRLQTHTRNM